MATPVPPEERPARRRLGGTALVVEDFRQVRRWLVVIGLVAAIGTGIAVYAAIDAHESAKDKADRARVLELDHILRARIAELDRRLAMTSEESDVSRLGRQERTDASRLDKRLRRVERDITDALDASASSGKGIDRLDRRLDALERRRR